MRGFFIDIRAWAWYSFLISSRYEIAPTIRKNKKTMLFEKEYFLKLLNEALDGQVRLQADGFTRGTEYCDGVKHVRGLFDEAFDEDIYGEDLLEFSVSLICSIQPEEPRHNRNLGGIEQGILAASYFLYSAMQPLVLANDTAEHTERSENFGSSFDEWPN